MNFGNSLIDGGDVIVSKDDVVRIKLGVVIAAVTAEMSRSGATT